MRKLIHVVNINDFFPELFALTYPTIRSYAERNGYMINMITERKFPDYPINYEKMQVYEDGKDAEVNILCDADMLIHPEFPDVTTFLQRNSIAFNDNYNISWKYHVDRIRYFMRDGRDVGIATNFVVSSDWTHGLKYTGVTWEDWMRPWLIHTGTGDKNEALEMARTTLEKWSRL